MLRLLLSRVRGAPTLWAARQILKFAKGRWDALPDGDRKELRRLVRKSRGRRQNLTAPERERLGSIVRAFVKRAERGDGA